MAVWRAPAAVTGTESCWTGPRRRARGGGVRPHRTDSPRLREPDGGGLRGASGVRREGGGEPLLRPQDGEAVEEDQDLVRHRVHLIADTRYEIPVACRVTRASQSEVKQLETMTEELFEETPELAKRCRDFSADRGLDSGPVKAKLWDDYGIRPLIEPRELWKEEKQEPGYNPTQGIDRCIRTGPIPSCIPKRGKWAASVPKAAGSDRWPSRASRRSGGR